MPTSAFRRHHRTPRQRTSPTTLEEVAAFSFATFQRIGRNFDGRRAEGGGGGLRWKIFGAGQIGMRGRGNRDDERSKRRRSLGRAGPDVMSNISAGRVRARQIGLLSRLSP